MVFCMMNISTFVYIILVETYLYTAVETKFPSRDLFDGLSVNFPVKIYNHISCISPKQPEVHQVESSIKSRNCKCSISPPRQQLPNSCSGLNPKCDHTWCASGLCIYARFWCDGCYDCDDGTDELDCPESKTCQMVTQCAMMQKHKRRDQPMGDFPP